MVTHKPSSNRFPNAIRNSSGLTIPGTLSKDHTRNALPTKAQMIPYLRIGSLKNHTLLGSTYLSSPLMDVPPTPGTTLMMITSLMKI